MEKTRERAKKDIILHERLRAKKLKTDSNFKKLLDKVFSDKEEYERIQKNIDEIVSSENILKTDDPKYQEYKGLIEKKNELRKDWKYGELEKMCGFCIPPTFTKENVLTAMEFPEGEEVRWLLWNTNEKIVDIVPQRKPKTETIDDLEDECGRLIPCERIIDPGYVDDEGFIHIKIKANPEIEGRNINQNLYLQSFKRILDEYVFTNKGKGRLNSGETKAYQVWEAWNNSGVSSRKGFKKIADSLNCSVSTAKLRWYRAYELIYGIPYNPRGFKEEKKQEAELMLCAKCKDPKCYRNKHDEDWIPCRKYLDVAGRGYLREKITKKENRITEDHFSFNQWQDSDLDLSE